jgi:hypothetical protein
MNLRSRVIPILAAIAALQVIPSAYDLVAQELSPAPEKGSVIFIHPEGAGVAAWGAARGSIAAA